MQQHCRNILLYHTSYLDIYMRKVYTDVHTYHTYVSDVLRFRLFHSNPGLALVEENHD